MQQLQAIIESAFEDRAAVTPATAPLYCVTQLIR